MQCEAQDVPFSSAKQAVCNDAVRPNPASQMCMLFVNKPYGLAYNPGQSFVTADLP